jgi:DNA primase
VITAEVIQDILSAAKIEDVVRDFVNIKRRGTNYIGLCPFHNERTPSFTVSPSKGIYKCFGCGKAGNAVGFIMEHEHYTYPEALKFLARKYNIEVAEEEETFEKHRELSELESLFSIHAFAQKFFDESLHKTEEGRAVGLSYFRSRGLSEHIINKFQLGYSLEQWDAFTAHAMKNGYSLESLVKSGLSIEKESRSYDRFRGRVIFPVHNITGRVIAFGGRILKAEENKPKYLNSPESGIYNKSKTLYGLFFARNAIVKNDNCYLVEGYTDVISLHQAGIENVVASAGTSLTADQIRLIKRYTPNITILYDGDEAGIKASFRGTDMILEQGMNVRMVLFPDGEDPDSYARKHRSSEVIEFLHDGAKDFIAFKTALLLKDAKNDPIKKASLIRDVVHTITQIPDGIYRSVYIKECSVMLDVAEQTLFNALNKMLREKFKSAMYREAAVEVPEPTDYPAEKQVEVDYFDTEYQERDIIRILMNYGKENIRFGGEEEKNREMSIHDTVAGFMVNDLAGDDITFRNPLYQSIFDIYKEALAEGAIPEETWFLKHPDEHIFMLAGDLLFSEYELSPNWEIRLRIEIETEKEKLMEAVVSSLLSLKAKRVEEKIDQVRKKIREAEGQPESYDNTLLLMKELSDYKKISLRINDKLGRIITR